MDLDDLGDSTLVEDDILDEDLIVEDDLLIEEYDENTSDPEDINTKVDIDDETDVEIGEDDEEVDDSETVSIVNKIKKIFNKKKQVDEVSDEDTYEEDGEEKKSRRARKRISAKKIPFLSKIVNKKSESDEENDDTEIEKSIDDEELDEPKSKVKITKLHAIIIVAAIAFFLFWDTSEEPTSQVKQNKQLVKSKNLNKPKPTKEIEERPKVVEVNDTDPIDQGDSQPEDTDLSKEPLDLDVKDSEASEPETDQVVDVNSENKDNVTDLSSLEIKEEMTTKKEPKIEKEPSQKVEKNIVDTVDLSKEINELKENIEENTIVKVDESEPSESSNEKTLDSDDSSEIQNEDLKTETVNEDVIADDIPKLSSDNTSTDITKKLLQDLEVKLKEEKKEIKLLKVLKPVGPPSYETTGAGLVYNCKVGHWACIEKQGFDQCRQNYSWNSSQKINIECYPKGLLDNEDDCQSIQQDKIDSVTETDFCN